MGTNVKSPGGEEADFTNYVANFFNVKRFGAVGDGTTDDTDAIQNAVNAAIDNYGGTVFFPTGEYLVTEPIRFDHGLPWTGDYAERPIVFRGAAPAKGTNNGGSKIAGDLEDRYIIEMTGEMLVTVTGISGTFDEAGNETIRYYGEGDPDPTHVTISVGGTTSDPIIAHALGTPHPVIGDVGRDQTSGALGTVTNVSVFTNIVVTMTGGSGTFGGGNTVVYWHGNDPDPVPPLSRIDDGNVLVHPGGGFGTPIVGEVATGVDSLATATVTNVVLQGQALCGIYDLCIMNYCQTSGGAIKFDNVHNPVVQNCFISGWYGLIMFSNAYHGIVTGCKFQGVSGSPAGTIGCYTVSAVMGCDFVGWDVAYQHASLGGGIYNCRFEVCRTGIRTGLEFDGEQVASTAWTAMGNYSERVDIGAHLFYVQGFVGGNNFTGERNVDDDGERTADYLIAGNVDLVMAGNSSSGKAAYTYRIAPASTLGNVTFIGCSSGNSSVLGGVKWSIAKADNLRDIYINCPDNPDQSTRTFAQLPATEVIGEQWVITDGEDNTGASASVGETVQGTGSQTLIVAWNGTVWKCVAVLA